MRMKRVSEARSDAASGFVASKPLGESCCVLCTPRKVYNVDFVENCCRSATLLFFRHGEKT